jgi:hypothetical protein
MTSKEMNDKFGVNFPDHIGTTDFEEADTNEYINGFTFYTMSTPGLRDKESHLVGVDILDENRDILKRIETTSINKMYVKG